MFKRLLQLLERKKETPEECEKREQAEVVQAMNVHQKGGDRIQEGLSQVRLNGLGNSLQEMLVMLDPNQEKAKIPENKLATYRTIVQELQKKLEAAPLTTLDTTKIDACIMELVTYFHNAVLRGNTESADWLIVNIHDGIQYSRAPFQEATQERKAAELQKRTERMENITAIAELQDVEDQLEEEIREIGISIQKKKDEQKTVQEGMKKFLDKTPNAGAILAIYRKTGEIKDKLFLVEYAKQANHIMNVSGDLDKLSLIQERKSMNKDNLDHVRNMMKIAEFMKAQPVTEQLLDRVNLIMERAENAVARQDAEKQYINEMERKGTAIFDVMEQNLLSEIDQIIRNFDKVQRKEDKDRSQIERERTVLETEQRETEKNVQKNEEKKLLYD